MSQRQLILFFVLAYAIAWLFFGTLALSRNGLGWIPVNLSLPIMTVLGSFAPSVAALLTLRLTEHRWPAVPRRFTLKALLVTIILAPAWLMLVYALAPALILTTGKWTALGWSILLSPSVYGLSTLIGGPLGEEPGWRGFALPRLQEWLGPAGASLLLGILWAGWHLPLFLVKSWSSTSFPNYLLMITGLSFSMTFLFNLSGGSIVAAIAVHAFFNTVSRWLGGLLGDAPLREGYSPELILGLAGWAAALLLLAATRGQLAYRRR
ncbi:MAG TPA: type II CAAX endopeptidase family protein [Bryobacteraceae bacterium]|jgi:membrane protease YdiL (CAAX protease family)